MLIGPPASAIVRDADGVLHVECLSGGKDSSAMALELRRRHPDRPILPVFTPTGNEPDELFAHILKMGDLVGSRIWPITCGLSLEGLIAKYKALPNWRQRWCTRELKIEPYAEWLAIQAAQGPVVSYVGLRADEPEREGGDYSDIPGVKMVFPMREWGWGIEQVIACLEEFGVCIPERTDCDWCFHQTLTEWRRLWSNKPDRYWRGSDLEQKYGHTFRSPSRDTWPADLIGMAARFAAGEIPRARKRDSSCRVCSK